MIDPEMRAELSKALKQLVDGEMGTDAFDRFYWTKCEYSQDRGVAEIGEFGYGLYDDLWNNHLKGSRAVDGEARRAAGRCLLFLTASLKYEWPDLPETRRISMILFFVMFVAALLAQIGSSVWAVVGCGVGFVCVPVIILLRYIENRAAERNRQQFEAAGDFSVWPFFRLSDYLEAGGSPCPGSASEGMTP
jgi:hypothetical protein